MKKLLIILTLLTVSLTQTFGQTAADSISMKKVFGGYLFYKGDKKLNMTQLVNTMKPNEEAYSQIKSAQSTYTLAAVVSGAGGFMIGWPIGTALAGGDPNWGLAGIGAALAVVSIPITKNFNKKAKLAVDTFNGGLHTSSVSDKTELRLSMTENGVGLVLRF